MHNPPPLTPRGMMLWRLLRSRPKGIPAFAVVFALMIVALASHGDASGIAFPLLIIFGPLLLLRSRTFALISLVSWLRRR